MKKLLIILLVANLAFFAAMKMRQENPDKAVNGALNESKIRLVSSNQAEVKPAPEKEAAVIQTRPEPSISPESKAVNPQPAAVEAKPEALCMEWGEFAGSELERAKKAIAGLAEKPVLRETEYENSYWVYMPPLKDRRAVIRKVREIKKLGIKEYFVVGSSDKWANAISLGVFKTQEAAEKHLKQLQTRGIRTAIVGERGGKLKTTTFVLNAVNPATKTNLQRIQKEFPDSELVNSTCALTKKDEIGKMPRSSR
ncbi:MAG TPA: SPOR domain-containing protein [Gallionella sp.]